MREFMDAIGSCGINDEALDLCGMTSVHKRARQR